MNGPQQTVKFEIPVIIPPELAKLTQDLITLTNDLRREIDFYRETREPLSYSEKELADHFGISLISMERIRRAGKISYTRVAGKIHYTRAQISEYLEKEQTKRTGGKSQVPKVISQS